MPDKYSTVLLELITISNPLAILPTAYACPVFPLGSTYPVTSIKESNTEVALVAAAATEVPICTASLNCPTTPDSIVPAKVAIVPVALSVS